MSLFRSFRAPTPADVMTHDLHEARMRRLEALKEAEYHAGIADIMKRRIDRLTLEQTPSTFQELTCPALFPSPEASTKTSPFGKISAFGLKKNSIQK